MEKGTVKDVAFFSKALNEELELLIYIPANYSPLYEYNILIASDGKDYFQLGGIPRLADELIDGYIIENTIIVGVPYKNYVDRKRKYTPTGDQFEAYMRFLAHELVPYLDEEYSTAQIGGGRALIGDSMAATISLMTAIHYPNIFGKAALQSPYVDEYVLQAVRSANNINFLSVYHIIGLQEDKVTLKDNTVKDFLTPNRELHQLLINHGIETFYDEFDGNHTWTYWKPDLKRALIEIFG
ncbi:MULTISPECIES: alpha/beta hydrolase [Solibacillus]|uniref:Esterase family protein n=1 Tax=Solibacillus merdavium TaxID=2762218 RepID=A0ABR8XHX0_9BACL|nr:alpha/beta hydrolase-fold protein [Solibacillus merdavium]MBD8031537.1 esterase family protein [Solibacillus merdavium]